MHQSDKISKEKGIVDYINLLIDYLAMEELYYYFFCIFII